MTKTDFISTVAKKSGITKKDAMKVVNSVLETIKELAKKDDTLKLPGFGTFKVVTRKARNARNPKTGELVKVPQKKLLRFTPTLELRNL
ncbi:HU family DNA-binding protein [Thermodesulfovibrio sp. TK110]